MEKEEEKWGRIIRPEGEVEQGGGQRGGDVHDHLVEVGYEMLLE